MDGLQERYLVDDQGKRIGVVLDIEAYQALLGALEELESLYAFDMAKADDDEAIPLEQAIAEIEQLREESP
jgi:hypothetical protein